MVLHFREATSVYRKTLPFVLLQFGIGLLFALLGVLYLGLILWLGVRFLAGDGGMSILIVAVVLLFGLLTFAGIWRLLNRYVLYLVKTGHVAVIAHVVDTGDVPENQIRYGFDQVREYFGSATVLFGTSELVDAVLNGFNRAVARIQSMIPIPLPSGLQNVIKLLQKSVELTVSYLDNAIIAYMFVDRNENRWASARDGLVLYGKTWKMVLGSTLLIVLGMYVLSFVLLLALAPVGAALDVLPTSIEALSWIVILGVVGVVHAGIVKPWVKTVVITTFLIEARGETPDSETMDWIAERSPRFTEVLERANEERAAGTPREERAGTASSAGAGQETT